MMFWVLSISITIYVAWLIAVDFTIVDPTKPLYRTILDKLNVKQSTSHNIGGIFCRLCRRFGGGNHKGTKKV